ncbi:MULTISPECIES: tautomerase family protein [unclassified Mesorhizobium]|uniref:tautomerase family protein n=1 Tax=unclassified Mesorhizobium TaxID=325217 RepID=UPI002414D561|nr:MULTISPECIES: tautomerase family protein [unclassified Mesorhizobium]MDG4889917.1 tautomerase family protein [Mesorhizobium sp. WSM4887]MDG4904060.1 tautomerase family protein [Mesorhizobium sp. WSM4962]MDG4909087.1 tautomerase family protein [Mesorhizobium sp. WSM4898]MDG4921711.1 tautomerase family protein [Mesorhizobium sp. WSM4989]
MPNVRIEMLAGRSREQKRELAEVFTREMARIANCKPEAVHVVFADVDRSDWAIGGALTDEPSARK